VLQIAGQQPAPQLLLVSMVEAIHSCATFAASGAFPDLMRHNRWGVLRDFEQAARSGFSAVWFKLTRDYKSFNHLAHAKDCFEHGVELGVESGLFLCESADFYFSFFFLIFFNSAWEWPTSWINSTYSPTQQAIVSLLHRAVALISREVPQPAYVYALLLSESSCISIPPQLFTPFIPTGFSAKLEAR
jgi:hypothetical protein